MNRQDTIKLLIVSGVSILLGALTILVVYFVTSRPAPSAPPSKPKAAGVCFVEFFFPTPGPTSTPTPTLINTPTPTKTPTPTPTPTGTLTPTPTGTLTPTPTTPVLTDTPTPTTIPSATPTQIIPSITQSPSLTQSPSATPTQPPGCYSTCSSNSECTGSMVCQSISGVMRCVNSSCPYNSDCVCGQTVVVNTPTPTPIPPQQQVYIASVPSPTPTIVVLQEAGISAPSWGAATGGALLILLGILFFAL